MASIRILFCSDTHLGYDLPFRPRIQRRRRGPEFFANFKQVLDDAVARGVDGIIHGGDLFFRSKVPRRLVEMAFEPIKTVADAGIPVFIVPGNHERSRIPHSEFAVHPNIHVFTRPRTFRLELNDRRMAISGFPFIRENIRGRFKHIVEQIGWRQEDGTIRLLCMHQSVEGATVGPSGYIFKDGADVIRARDIPKVFSAVLSGHIHRFQVLERDLCEKPLGAPVFYPGAIDRVSFAERDEIKGYLLFKIDPAEKDDRSKLSWTFHRLPTRPMEVVHVRPGPMRKDALIGVLECELGRLPEDAIVSLNINGRISDEQLPVLRAESVRSLAPATMNVHVRLMEHH